MNEQERAIIAAETYKLQTKYDELRSMIMTLTSLVAEGAGNHGYDFKARADLGIAQANKLLKET